MMLINQETNNYLPSIQMPLAPQTVSDAAPLLDDNQFNNSPIYSNGLVASTTAPTTTTTTEVEADATPTAARHQENNFILDLDCVDDDDGDNGVQPAVNYNNGYGEPRIPDSHLTAASQQYPSLTHVPKDIAKSFAPIFVQPQNQQIHQGSDIYTDYVNNPYNLVLQPQHGTQDSVGAVDAGQSPTPVVITSNFAAVSAAVSAAPGSTQQLPSAPATNVFQSSNYFGTDNSSVVIPPGSEMLFTGP